MVDLTELKQRREDLLRNRTDGVARTKFGEDEVEYRSDSEIAAALASLDREIAALEGRQSVQTINFRSKRGW